MTETYRDVTFISTDSHVTEPIEIFAERVDVEFRDRVPRIETVGEWRTLADREPEAPAAHARVRARGRDRRRLRCRRPSARSSARRRQRRSDLPDVRAAGVLLAPKTPDSSATLCRAYNSWAIEVFDDPRLLPVGMVSMLDIDGAIEDAKRVAEQGFRALFLPAQVPQRPYNDEAYDPFWAVAEDLGLPLTFHSGTGHEPRVLSGPGGAVVNYLMGAQLDGPMVMLTMAAGGALDRFPGLRVVTVETGAAWLGWIMTQADAIYEDHNMWARPKLSLKPSELIRRQCAATFMYDPVAINNRDDHRRGDADVGQRLPAPRRHVAHVAGRRRRPVRGRVRRRRRGDRRPETRRRSSASTLPPWLGRSPHDRDAAGPTPRYRLYSSTVLSAAISRCLLVGQVLDRLVTARR